MGPTCTCCGMRCDRRSVEGTKTGTGVGPVVVVVVADNTSVVFASDDEEDDEEVDEV